MKSARKVSLRLCAAKDFMLALRWQVPNSSCKPFRKNKNENKEKPIERTWTQNDIVGMAHRSEEFMFPLIYANEVVLTVNSVSARYSGLLVEA